MASPANLPTDLSTLRTRPVTAKADDKKQPESARLRLSPKQLVDETQKLARNLDLAVKENKSSITFLPPWLEGKRYSWPKGQSGNPAGRPKTKSISKAYREMADQIEPLTGLTYAQLMAQAMFYAAINKGNVGAAREIREALEGSLVIQADAPESVNSVPAAQKLLQRLMKIEQTTVKTTVTVAETKTTS